MLKKITIRTKKQSVNFSLLFALGLILALMIQTQSLIVNLQINKAYVGINHIGQNGNNTKINFESLLLNADKDSSQSSKCIHRGLGQLYWLQENIQASKYWLLKSIEICQENPITNYFLGRIFWENDDKINAIILWQQARVDNYFLTLGKKAATDDNFDDAINAFRTALEINPSLSDAQIGLGKALVETGQAENAITELQKNFNSFSEQQQKERYLWLGHAWVATGRLKEALVAYQEAYNRTSENDGYIADFLGRTYYKLGQYREAETYLLESIQYDAKNPYVNYLLANIFLIKNEWQTAEKHIIQALKTEPTIPVYHELLGDIYHTQNKTGKSLQEYHTAFCLSQYDNITQNRIKEKLNKLTEITIKCFEE